MGGTDPHIFVRGFDRPNIWLGVETFHDKAEKQTALLKCVVAAEKPGIIYAKIRKYNSKNIETICNKYIIFIYDYAEMKASEHEQV